MIGNQVGTLSDVVEKKSENAATLDHAMHVAGIGWYNIKYCLVLALFLIAAIIEPIGYAYILPASKCDLNITDAQRGFLASVPYIGIVLTSFPWGYLVDTRGRKKSLILSSLAAGLFVVLSAFMPDFISFTVCKFMVALCIACPAAAPYTFIGELVPLKYRDVTLSVTNAMQILGSVIVPLFAWAVLPLDFRVDFGAYDFRPWRLLTIMYGLLFIIAALLLLRGPESPKYLLSQGRYEETLDLLKMIYSKNRKKSPDEFSIKSLKIDENVQKEKLRFLTSLKVQTLPLFKPPYLKWMALNSSIFFGILATANGLYVWVPDLINRVLMGDSEGATACEIIAQRLNTTGDDFVQCDDSLDTTTFLINTVANFACAIIAIVASSTVKIIGKKTLLVAVLLIIGLFCALVNVVTQDILFVIFLSAMPVIALAIGPVNAYAVQIFPTHLRGMAVSLSMMIGRVGSIIGANIAGIMLNAACEVTFYFFGGILMFCGLLSFLLPSSKEKKTKEVVMTKL
ncbi:synaptic vesicle glycoprotein 2C-like [Papilio machaon]|uniref:synaptic vesicle glycoprotein 2C-like n=1 Tax=Papilio machaon TaxID=76193 RepID=UPI001E665DAB|nr:synaptic vesicle glycoprotein 2C-like [Papilio machaon]XP_045534653.1 synaptic vesicle glycoprotein 2C-like [Papilio machaon]XP_045534654.1 synaptic vesicle glycoprotein 2C-like [Papilio machaon]